MSLLEIRDISKSFGGVAAVDGVSIDVNAGEILGLVGPNGAGKTTLFNLVTGFARPTRGKVTFKGEDVTGLKPNKIAGKGIVRTFQASGTLFQSKPVLENVLIASHLRLRDGPVRVMLNTRSARAEEEHVRQRALDLLDSVGLSSARDQLAMNLPHGHQRLLGVCMALAADPELLLLDEPVTGLTPEETSLFMAYVRQLRDHGITVLLVEHNMKAVMSTCDRIVVLNHGRKIAEGTPQEISRNEEVITAYLGSSSNAS
jgi:branched-chain amino acid transport system ATP-binding protein